ncbi:alpha-amylase family glycosyl hydrolase [Massilia sp. DWR3-1-1]|uniref:alpha-amylase family glycosyl hydrolase n=1 Tax=Massilia sp. DWR3-1-1 TaxID=2804559 RepID=UPI003CE7697E
MTMHLPFSERLLAVLPAHLRADAARRYAEHGAVLHGRLAHLYGDSADFSAWYGDLLEAAGRLHGARPAPLLAQDAARENAPQWFASEQMLGYSAYVRQFGGTLQGVAGRIAHLREAGVNYLHLLPFLRPRDGDNDGGFALASFDDVDPALGSNDDLDALCTALREAGISLCADLVLNHVADDHPWAQGAAAGDGALREFFHVYPDRTMPDRFEATLAQVFPQAAPGNFTWVEALGGWVWTTFYPFQWDLNYANPAVFAELAAALLRLANRGVDAFRLDSTAFLWKREGTSCMNQPEAHTILQALRALVDIVAPGVLLKAEAIVATRHLPAYFGTPAAPECQLAYHSSLMAAGWAALAEQDTAMLRTVIATTPPLPPGASWITYVRCHDDIGWKVLADEAGADAQARLDHVAAFYHGAPGSFARGVPFQSGQATNGSAAALAGYDLPGQDHANAHALRRLLLLHGLAYTFGGLPLLYMGDELGMQNDEACLADPVRALDTRWVQRSPLDAARLAQRDDPASGAGAVFAALGALGAQRRAQPALAAGGARRLLPCSDAAVLALLCGEDFLNLSNFSGRAITLDLASLQAGHWPGQAATVMLAPWAMLWLTRDGAMHKETST